MQRSSTFRQLFKLARASLGASRLALLAATFSLISFNASAQLSGTYTICKTGCDYSDLSSAASDLDNKGVNGAVTFNVAAETFNESFTVYDITGASATNTITFKGQGAGSTRLYDNGSYTLRLSGADYIHFEDMTIENNRSSSTRRAVYITSGTYNVFKNCHLYVPSTSSSGYVVYMSGSSSYNEFHNNRIEGAYYSVYSSLSSSYNYGYNKFVENNIVGFYYYGLRMYYNYKNEYLRNTIDSSASAYSYAYGIYSYREGAPLYEGNRIPGYNMYYGIRVYYPNYYGKSTPYKVYNNMIGGSNSDLYYGIYEYAYNVGNANVQYFHNTIEIDRANGYALYIYNYSGAGKRYIKNNMLTHSSSSGPAFGLYAPAASDEISGNNFYTSGGNFIYYGATWYNDHSSWLQAASNLGHGQNSHNVAPEYVSGTDLHWDPSKPAPYGEFAGVTKDYDGDTRCNLFPTTGADENNFGKSKPVVKIFGNTTVIQGTPTVFYNSAKAGEPKIHAWYIDGVYQTDSIHLETTKLSGPSHTIKLVTEGCGGKDSATFNVSVQLPTKAPVSDFIADKNQVLQGAIINFFDLSINGPSQWNWEVKPDSTYDFGMKVPSVKLTYGDFTTPKWQGKFNYPGMYEICLTASNSKGKGNTECKTDYIEVLPGINIGSQTVIKNPKGYLFDDGGANGQYTGYVERDILIDPCADSVYLVFNKFDINCGYSYIKIYEGTDENGTELHPCTSNQNGSYGPGLTGGKGSYYPNCNTECMPGTDTFKAKGTMYITMDANWNYGDGFEAYWWSKPKTQKAPVAKFTSVDTICTNGVVTFTNETVGDEVSYTWDLDGDPSFYEASSKNTNWPYFFPGQYTVTMIAQNCGGMDTFTKVITVLDPPTPAPDFKADNTNPTTNDIVYFSSTTEECVDDYEWTFTKKYGTGTVTYVNGTGNSSVAPQVVFPDTGLWHVELKATNVTGSGTEKKDNYINVKGSYCNPSVSNVLADVGISKVVFNNINNSSTQGVDGYQNFTPTVSTTIEIGVKYTLTVERTSNKNKANRTVWIDWNGDGDFDDAQEQVADQNNSSALSWSEDITVPSFAAIGATKMRIAINQANYANKVCGQNEFGEYEDYRLYISADVTPPVITMKGDDTVRLEQGYAYTDSGATAVDNLDGDITANIIMTSTPTFNELIPNTYVFTYTVEDAAGNEAKPAKRVVIITPDVTPPALRVEKPETLTVAVNEPYAPLKVISADDLVDGDMTGNVSINDPVNPAVVGTYVVSYTTMDLSNNDTTVTRVVEVIDSIAPTMDLIGADTVLHDVNTTYTDSGVIVSDNYYPVSDLNANLTTSNNVDETTLGTYIVNYVLSDPSGNGPITVQRVVKVVDREAPVLSTIGDTMIKLEVFETYDDPGIRIDDNYYTITEWDTAGTFYQEFPDGETNKLGMYTIIYEVTDGSGNMSTITRYIEVADETPPVIALEGIPSVTVCRWVDYQDEGYDVSDNFWDTDDVTVTMEGSFVDKGMTDMPGFYSFRYKAEDQSGNVAYSSYRYVLVLSETESQCISGIDNNDLSKQVSIYPNPNSGKFNVTTELPGTDRVRISITNTLGQEVAVISNGAMGSNTFTVDLSDQAGGVYLLKVVSKDYSITKQIVVHK